MRHVFVIAGLALGIGALTACQAGPVFQNIKSVKVRHIGTSGLTDKTLDAVQQQELIKCLYATKEIEESQALRDLLQTTYLLEISDNKGDRSFELYTQENLKGNKGKYYVNRCVYRTIAAAN